MERALLLTGVKENLESYQLFIDRNFFSITYVSSNDRSRFYREICDFFVQRILEETSPLELGFVNGLRINPDTGIYERIMKLDELLLSQFSGIVYNILDGRKNTTPARQIH